MISGPIFSNTKGTHTTKIVALEIPRRDFPIGYDASPGVLFNTIYELSLPVVEKRSLEIRLRGRVV